MVTAVAPQIVIPPYAPGTRETTGVAPQPATQTDVASYKTVTPAQKVETFSSAAEKARESRQERVPSDAIRREEFQDEESGSLVYRAIDTNTGEVVRQIPDESLLRLRRALAETTHVNLTGIGFDRKV
ncbi:flagellar protein FlaG [Stappia sp. F7233]|uniref:Flagellar protein FlaG n=1 Tax=Stappia albiluteola TaxID=2758565 RepID=A0A839AHW1_9HYPH|nr:flagellar protein FlaG [Stappia albiluteola]MBA5779311.1 flagellar protein FlaG [Stappia albiluteola]